MSRVDLSKVLAAASPLIRASANNGARGPFIYIQPGSSFFHYCFSDFVCVPVIFLD